MRAIFLDTLRRRWWVLVLIVAGGETLMALPGSEPGDYIKISFCAAVIIVGCVMVSSANLRVLLTLPVSARQIGQALWWGTVGIPNLTLAAISAVVIVLIRHSGAITISLHVATCSWLAITVLMGALFFFYRRLLSSKSPIQLWGSLLLYMAIGTLPMYFYSYFPIRSIQWCIFLAVASAFTVAGWAGAEDLVHTYSAPRRAYGSLSSATTKPSRCSEGRGGLVFLAQSMFTLVFGAGLLVDAIVLIMFFVMAVLYHAQRFVTPKDFDPIMICQFIGFWLLIGAACMHVRFLRTLPISTSKLSAMLVLIPAAAIAALFWLSIAVEAFLGHPQLNPMNGGYMLLPLALFFIGAMGFCVGKGPACPNGIVPQF